MSITASWRKESGSRIEGSRALDISKLQAPCIVRIPAGGFRLFYTAVGPAKPYPKCQGYILSGVSDDGLVFQKEPGIRLAPQADNLYQSLRILSPTIVQYEKNLWRMYFESRGSSEESNVICSAVSEDLFTWKHEAGIRLRGFKGLGGPRYVSLGNNRGRLYCIASELVKNIKRSRVVSAVTEDGLSFDFELGYRMMNRQSEFDSMGLTAAEVIKPLNADDQWTMFYSAWQDVSDGHAVPDHPSLDDSLSEDFAAASIASDMAGYRSRIFISHSNNGLEWNPGECIIDGGGYKASGIDAVHAEDMSVIKLDHNRYRMYYACCDNRGIWRIASAVNTDNSGLFHTS